MKKFFILTAFAVPLLLALFIGGYIVNVLQHTYQGEDTTFEVKNGDTFGRINQRLFEQGLIPDKRVFHYYAKYKKILTKFQAGNFTIKRGSNFTDVANTLVYGLPNLTTITIPEGKNMYEIAKIIEQSGICSEQDFLNAAQLPEMISHLNVEATNLEGYLYPETYRFAPKTPAKTVVKTMIDLFNAKTGNINFSHPFLSKHEVIILASVVEKETGAKVERPLIAGVFTNRLKKRMRLQSDPTTVYGIWSRYTGNIRKSDLLEFTPYNTYKIPALPIGPIANPSIEAIKAVLSPESHDYLYFVSKNDGTHVFSKSYEDHNRAVGDYQKNASARKGKSWRNLKQ